MIRLLVLVLSIILMHKAIGCTTAVISGKYTEDGRPMIWKLRDTDYLKNKLMYFEDGKYNYIGLVNSEDKDGKQVWAGSNSAGFSIMNSASFNVNLNDTVKLKDQEGVIMKNALQSCASVDDFKNLLIKLPKPMGLAAHFGVIDATGAAVFIEVNNHSFTIFDANNPADAPNGYILRTNYSFTGKKDVGYGFIRYQTAQDIFYRADATKTLNYKTIIQDFSRCLKHPILNKDFRKEFESIPEGEHFINSGDLITRHGSSSSILIQGVTKDEPTDLSTIWTTVGFPNTCLTLPVWVRGGSQLPMVLLADGSNNSPLNEMALELKKECYPIERSSGYKYLQISKLINAEKTGIVQIIEKVEQKIFTKTEEQVNKWSLNQYDANDITSFYNWLDKLVVKTYKSKFEIEHN